jgi:arginyl-tRNA synthetase
MALPSARSAIRGNLREALAAALPVSKLVERIDIAGAGFINIVLTAAAANGHARAHRTRRSSACRARTRANR